MQELQYLSQDFLFLFRNEELNFFISQNKKTNWFTTKKVTADKVVVYGMMH